jgi:catechol 2,3-dioxygenase-like lactoylglutathione lyase family enzyme
MSTAQLDLIGIIVEDMARSLAFYRRLGLDLPTDADSQPHVEATLPGGIRLAWDTRDTVRSFYPNYEAASGGPRIGLAFRSDTPADVDAIHEKLVAAGYHGHKAPGQRYALIHDPDGNSVDLFAPLPPADDAR